MQTIPTYHALRVKLAQHHGQLPEIARISGVGYSVVYRIANGSYGSSPSLRTAELLWNAADSLTPPAKKKAAKRRAK